MNYKNKSIWNDIKQNNICPALNKNIDVDVLIIGGGITGISTAYHLINKNLKVCLVERNKIASGVTSRTTGKLTYLQEGLLSKIKNFHGLSKTKEYLESQIEAINIVKNIANHEKIDCNLEQVDSYVISNKKEIKTKKEIDLLKELNIQVKLTNKLPNGLSVDLAYYINNTYVFHPLKYLYALKDVCIKNGISIYERTNIVSIEKKNNYYECYTKNNKIKAKYIVLAVHYPFFLFPFLLPLKSSIEKSYIKAKEIKENYNFSAITISKPTESIRYYNSDERHYEIFLNGSHNTCSKFNYQKNFNNLFFSKENINYLWSNKDIITNDYLPFIGSIDNENSLLIGTGYNTWGMTNGTIAGKILADIILKNPNKYVSLFNPYRKLGLGDIVSFPIILGRSICSFTKAKIKKQKKWYPENVRFEKRNGKNIAIYIDDNKKEHIVYNLCPHLKCSLLFNNVEKTWDCPCHGSRFDIDGNVIEGPSNHNITYKEK